MMILPNIIKDFILLMYPPCCEACSEKLYAGEACLCTSCWIHLPKTGFFKEKDNLLTRMFWGRVAVETGASLFYYDKGGRVQKLIHRLKYKGGTTLGYYLGRRLGQQLAESANYDCLDYIIPVPLHKDRLRKRGFNQSEMIGMGLSSVMNIPVRSDVLRRVSSTQSQTRKRRFMRWENVESVFKVEPGRSLKNKNILLVDDVSTTGSTLEACSVKLIEAGARVWIATIGITV